jgi:glyoxylate reductase
MSTPSVFVSRVIPEAGLAKVRAHCNAVIWPEQLPPTRSQLLEAVRSAEGLLALLTEKIDRELLEAAPKLKVVSNFAVGVNNIDLAACKERGIKVGNTPGVLTQATADIAFALLMAAARRMGESIQSARDGHWKTWEPCGYLGLDLVGKTLGIVGMGRIGYSLAKRCYWGWDMPIVYTSPRIHEEAQSKLRATKVSFEELLAQSDFISVHTPLTPETKGMFNKAAFARMKPSAVFINTARGPIHVESDLKEALRSNTIFAAGLDVTDPEPPNPGDDLLQLPNCVVLPHIGSATFSTRDAMAEIAADNLIAGLLGKPLRHEVQS